MNTRIIHMVERIPGSAAILAAFTWLSLDSRSCVAHDKSGAFMEAGAVDVVCAFTSGTLPERTKLFLDEATRVVKKPGLIFTVDIPPGHYGGDLCSIFGAPGKLGASSGWNSRPGKGKEPPHQESSLGFMEVTTWIKRRQSDARAVMQVK